MKRFQMFYVGLTGFAVGELRTCCNTGHVTQQEQYSFFSFVKYNTLKQVYN